jgi:uncharacterized protein (TIGR03083 family)
MAAEEIDYGTAYSALRDRVIALVGDASDDQLEARAPATPEWRVRDVLAHVVGVTADILSGAMDGVATDAWTDKQVQTRRDAPVDALLAEWEANGPAIDPLIPSFGGAAGQFLTDALTHEQDIRGALGTPGARECDAMAIAFDWIGALVGGMRDAGGAGALEIGTECGHSVFGTGAPTRCTATRFEFLRATTGRRSVSQIEAWGWDGDPRVDTVVLPIFTPRPGPLVE